jgi:hypothetical protein
MGKLILVVGCLLACLPVLGYSTANADDITLQVGGRFSIYAPPACHRVERSNFALVLNCDFRGKAVRFFMKEFPTQLGEEFNPRTFPPSKLDQGAYRNSAAHTILDELDPDMGQHLIFRSWGSTTGDDVDALFWGEGYFYDKDPKDYENIKKCGLLRVQTFRNGLSAVLVAIADIDGVTKVTLACRGLPEEVSTILGSLGGMFEGGRSLRSRQ